MRKASAVLATFVALTLPFAANAAPCKDAKGKFIKCPAVATSTAKPATAAHKAAAKPTKTAATGKVQHCRNSKGQFAKCGTPGAKPA